MAVKYQSYIISLESLKGMLYGVQKQNSFEIFE